MKCGQGATRWISERPGGRPDGARTQRLIVAVIVAECRCVAPGYADGGLDGVPHSAQNFAVGLRLALQLVQCLAVAVPHSGQNLAPTCTALWQLLHAMVGAAAGASAGAGAGAAAGGAC